MEMKKYANLRFSPDVFTSLMDMKLAFESSYGRHMTHDEFLEKLIASVEGGEPAVWEAFCGIQTKKDNA